MTASTFEHGQKKKPGTRHQGISIVVSGAIGGLDGIGYAVAVATLFFAGSLSSGVSMAAAVCLLASVIFSIFIGWRSEIRSNTAQIQDMGVAVLTGTLAVTAAQMQAGPDIRVATAFAILAMASLATGLLLSLTGWLGAGRIVRYFPLEVLAGFMAGTGWLLASGSMAAMTGNAMGLGGWFALSNPETLLKFLPGLLFGIAVYAAMNLFRHPLTLVGILGIGIAIFYAWLFWSGGTVQSAAAQGLLPSIDVEASLQLPFPAMLHLVDWSVVLTAGPAIATVAILCLFATLMNTSALELASGKDIRMDDELKSTGYANTIVALVSGPPGYSDLSLSTLATKLGVINRGSAMVMAAVLLVGFAFTRELVSHIPIFVSAGLILYFGIDLLKDWLIDTYKKFSLREWGVVFLILVVVAGYGFLVALIVGFLIATILFAYSYANTTVIRSTSSLALLPSSTERSAHETAFLSDAGNGVKILQLQGFLFFGTTEQVLARIRNAVENENGHRLEAIIINFRRVTNIDSGSAASFQRVQTLAQKYRFRLILCGLRNETQDVLVRAGVDFGGTANVVICEDLDRALDMAENMLLTKRTGSSIRVPALVERFAENDAHAEKLARLFAAADRKSYAAGETIIRGGDDSDVLYLLESGRVMIAHKLSDGRLKRIRTMSSGAILGEIAFCLGSKRSADVVAEEPSVILSIAVTRLRELEQNEPDLAILLHRLISRALAEKVFVANRIIEYADGE